MNRVLAHGLAVLLTAAVLAGCSDDDKLDPGTSPSTSGSTTTTAATDDPYPSVPGDPELTEPGSDLSLGDSAVVAWQPRKNSVVGVLDLEVARLEKTSFKKSFVGWKLDDATKESTPYFVHVTVKNTGETDLGGFRVPLYIVDGEDTLVESSSFASKFKPCPSTPLPDKFKSGAKAKVCLVYLSPHKGELTAVSFRPVEAFDPIEWRGEVKTIKKDKPKKGEGDQG